MADTPKILGQSQPAAGVVTDLYSPGAAKSAVMSTLRMANLSNSIVYVRVTVAAAAAADNDAQSVLPYGGMYLQPGESLGITEGWMLNTTDVLRVKSQNGQVVFTLFGVERA